MPYFWRKRGGAKGTNWRAYMRDNSRPEQGADEASREAAGLLVRRLPHNRDLPSEHLAVGVEAEEVDSAGQPTRIDSDGLAASGLLARCKTNGEIAEALCISPHTARHHTEAVLRKLEVGSRRQVARRVVGKEDVGRDRPLGR